MLTTLMLSAEFFRTLISKKSHKIEIDEGIDKVLFGEVWYALQFPKCREGR